MVFIALIVLLIMYLFLGMLFLMNLIIPFKEPLALGPCPTPLLVHSLSLLPFQWLTYQHNPILYHVHVDLA
jgi:hypothetical protein